MVSQQNTMGASFMDSFWASDEEQKNTDDNEIFQKFFESNEKLKAEIIGYDIITEKKDPHTVYNIKVVTDLKTYVIQKRFSKFDELRQMIKLYIKELNMSQVAFPGKTYFNKNSIETIERRKVQLNGFLNFLCSTWKQYENTLLLQFLEVSKYWESGLSSSFLNLNSGNSQEITQLLQYLEALETQPDDLSKNMKDLHNFYLQIKPRVNIQVAKALIIGKSKQSKGLIHCCGKFDRQEGSHLVCTVGLNLLQMFMDHQLCQDAEHFQNVFTRLALEEIKLLNFEDHIKSKSNCKGPAMYLLDTYLKKQPEITADDIFQTNDAKEEFKKWRMLNDTTSRGTENYNVNEKMEFDIQEVDSTSNSLNSLSNIPNIKTSSYDGSLLYKDDQIKIKYSKNKNMKISINSKADYKSCAKFAKDGIDYITLVKSQKKLQEQDKYNKIYCVTLDFPFDKYDKVIFIPERKYEKKKNDNYQEQVIITESPNQLISIILNADEIISKRIVKIELTEQKENAKFRTKIKAVINNLDEPSRALQDHLLKTMNEKQQLLIVENCKNFLQKAESE